MAPCAVMQTPAYIGSLYDIPGEQKQILKYTVEQQRTEVAAICWDFAIAHSYPSSQVKLSTVLNGASVIPIASGCRGLGIGHILAVEKNNSRCLCCWFHKKYSYVL